MPLYKGYVETRGKKSIEKLKGRSRFSTLEEIEKCGEYGGVLADDTILIDIDDRDESEILMNIVEKNQLDCKVIDTTRGRHFLFKNKSRAVVKNYTHATLALGLTADIKIGSKCSYEVLKIGGALRFCEWDTENDAYEELPKFLLPVSRQPDFLEMEAGDGRNQSLFNYILTLTAAGFTKSDTRETIKLINDYIIREKLSDNEIETILRDEAFQKPAFFDDKKFLHDKFASWMINEYHIIKFKENGEPYIYRDGVYTNDSNYIITRMINNISSLRKTQISEVMFQIEHISPVKKTSACRYIAFGNGVLDIESGELLPFNPDIHITNRISWNYDSEAYDRDTDRILDNLSCGDAEIRSLLEECIGYCFYRRNELGKAFILTGDKSNGKSTFLNAISNILGEANICSLDLGEMGDRFRTATLAGKLADIGDDISDDFLQGSQTSIFKKVVTGETITAERKGQDPFAFNPYCKLLFSANEVPRMRDRTGAILRRLIIIPFNARFSKDDPDFDPYAKDKLLTDAASMYLIRLGVEGLKRVLRNRGFTESEKVKEQLEEYNELNNPITGFIKEYGADNFIHKKTNDVYANYQIYCNENVMNPVGSIMFSRIICNTLRLETKVSRFDKRTLRTFERRSDNG